MSVKIDIKTTIFQENSEDIIELTAHGHFYQKRQSSFLQYEEIGESGKTQTTLKWSGEEALIMRSGAIKSRMPFLLNTEMKGFYELPFGKVETAAIAKKISHSYNPKNGKGFIDIHYDFFMQESHAGTYHLEITFQED